MFGPAPEVLAANKGVVMVEKWMVETSLSERYPFYTRANVGEVFPDPVAPMTFSFGFQKENGELGGAEIGFREAYYRIGVMTPDEMPDDECVFMGVAGGYAYLNAAALRMLGHRAPGMTAQDIDDSFFGDAPGVPPFVPQEGDDRPDLTAKIGETFGWALTTPDLPDVLEHERMMNKLRTDRPDFASMTDQALVDYCWALLDEHFANLFTEHIFISFLATLPIGIITGVCEAVGQPTSTLKLLAGLGDVESAAPSMAMWELGRKVAASPTLTAMFDEGYQGLDARIRASDDPDAVAFAAAMDDFQVHYGARGPNEWETRSPTWETDPDLALAAIDRMRLSPESSAPITNNEARAAERKEIGASIAAMLEGDPETQGQFVAALNAATVFMPGRERTKTNCIKLIQECRMAMREFGRRQVEAGHFPNVNSYGMQTVEEQKAFLEDPTGWYEILEQREAHYREVGELQEPFLFVGDPGSFADYGRRDAATFEALSAGDTLQGVPGCPEPGDILVAPITDPSWTPLFVPAGAVVVDVGAPLSHAIIVSRELGIPCVVSATDATKRIPDGALIEVDGDTGLVTVIELP
jgi:pyruvate,water dikinase